MQHRRILVTGGGGFLGQWLARRLLARGLRVRLMDLPRAQGAAGQEGVEWHAGDVRRADDVRAALAGCDGVAHLAGLLTPACLADPVRGAEVNLLGSLHLFEAARQQGLDRVVYASTAGVYGPHAGQPLPITHYGAFKLATEGAARASWHAHGLASVGLRPYVVYGPERLHGASAGPSLACRAAVQGEPCTIGYSGAAGLVYVDDVAHVFEHALLDAPAHGAQVFNLAGAVHTVDEVIAEIHRQVPGARLAACGPPLGIAPDIGEDGLDAWFPDRPRTSLAQGIAATLAHYRHAPGTHPKDNP
jgi:nucleoside-diphosphate-sugar epimerase